MDKKIPPLIDSISCKQRISRTKTAQLMFTTRHQTRFLISDCTGLIVQEAEVPALTETPSLVAVVESKAALAAAMKVSTAVTLRPVVTSRCVSLALPCRTDDAPITLKFASTSI